MMRSSAVSLGSHSISGAELDRRVKRVKGVFRNGRAKVQAAVSETVWARIERISP
jgi:hypothetical protein